MALGKGGLDRALTLEEPIERGIEFVLADFAQGQFDAETGGGGDRIERLGGGELGSWGDDALTIMATTRSTGRQLSGSGSRALLGPMILSRPMARVAPSTAATWPCGSERSMAKGCSPGGNTTPPLRTPRRPSTCSAGQW